HTSSYRDWSSVVCSSDLTCATGNVDALAQIIIKQIIGVSPDGQVGDASPGLCIEYKQTCRAPAADEQTMIRFIERHRKIRLEIEIGRASCRERVEISGCA